MENQKFTRKELYDLVWSTPMLTLSKKYNISDTGLRKICIRQNIPIPKAGHWQKIQFGKKITQIPLPISDLKEQIITLNIRSENEKSTTKELSPLSILKAEIEEQLKSKLNVPDKLSNPDKLIISARDRFNTKDTYRDKGRISSGRDVLDITVAKENIPRALRLMDTLIKALKERNHVVKVNDFKTSVVVNSISIAISLREKTKRITKESKYSWDNYDYVPAGLLIIKIDESYRAKDFIDGKLPLEKQLFSIIASIELLAIKELEWKEECRKSQEKRELEEKIRKEYEKRQEKDLEAFASTLKKAKRWHKAVNLRNYINEVESKAIDNNNLTDEIKTWLIWARKKADWYDPFIESEDELLNDIDKETLSVKKKSYYY